MVQNIQNPAPSDAPKPVILVVDDDTNNLAVVRDCLVEFNYTVLVAEDGETAIQRADYARPDLILLDIMMPGIDGYETCRRLKTMAGTQEIPVIFMTALAETGHKVKGLAAGAVDYITKPFQRQELQARIAVHLHNRELTKRLQEAKELLEKRVEERTAELAATNIELQAEISERKQAAEELKQHINRQKAILNNIPDIAWLKDRESKFIAINEALENAMGFKNADVVGKTDLDFFPLDLAEHYRRDDMEVMKSGNRKQVEEYFSDKEGRIVWLETIKTPILNEHKEVIGTTGIARDITERKQTEKALQQSEKRYKSLVETANDAVIGMTRSGAIYLWNKKAEAMFGHSADEAIGKDLHQLIVPAKYHEAAYAGLKVFTETGEGAIIGRARELTALRKDGTEFPAELSVSAVETEGEWSALGIVRDITERKQLQDALRLSAGEWQRTFDAINDGIVLMDKNHAILQINKAVTNIVGMQPAEIVGNHCYEVFHKTAFPIADCPLKVVKDTNKRESIVQPIGNRWFEFVVDPLLDSTGDFIGSVHIIKDITERRRKDGELLESERRFRSTFEQAAVGIAHIAPDGTLLRVNRKLCDIVGYTHEELLKLTFQDVTFVDDLDSDLEFIRQILADELQTYSMEKRYIRKDRSIVWIELTVSLVRDSAGEPDYFISVIEDISVRKAAQEEMQKLSISVEQSTEAFVITDTEGRIEYVNTAAQQITGYSRDELVGNTLAIFKSGLQDENVFRRMWATIRGGNSFTDIFINRNKNGDIYFLHEVIGPLKDAQGKIVKFIATGRDITQQKMAEQQLNYLVYNDPLTGISNRNFYTERLEREIARVARDKKFVAVVVIDIDRFKFINDTRGPAFGDTVLKTVAERLAESIRKGDIVARLGSDEFGLILVDIKRSEDIVYVFDKIMNKVFMPVEEDLRLTISGGVAIYPNDGESVEDLLMSADIALLKAKKEGGNNIQFVAPEMTVRLSEFATMEKRLVKALREKEFVIYYQPYWNINSKVVTGMEALIRWRSKDLGLVPPGRFIPILEETGLIIDVGKWVMQDCCLQVKEWLRKGCKAVPVSINLSTIQFRQKDLLETITKAIEESAIDPQLITLEITESAIMDDSENAKSVLQKLKQQGVSISIDDFGTGYSSLSYLRRFPIDNLKIDISFIRDLADDPDAASIVTAIIGMAHTLGLTTIAEGIETEEQWKILRLLRCNLGQGFYFSKPLPAGDIEKFFTG